MNHDMNQENEKPKMENDSRYKVHAEFCKLFGNSKRLQIMDLLRNGERQAGELCERLDINPANLSQHLSLLKRAGAISDRREGNNIFYSLTHMKIIQAIDLLQSVIKDILAQRQDQMDNSFDDFKDE